MYIDIHISNALLWKRYVVHRHTNEQCYIIDELYRTSISTSAILYHRRAISLNDIRICNAFSLKSYILFRHPYFFIIEELYFSTTKEIVAELQRSFAIELLKIYSYENISTFNVISFKCGQLDLQWNLCRTSSYIDIYILRYVLAYKRLS